LLPPFYNDTESEIIGVPVSKLKPNIVDPDRGKYDRSKLDIHKFAFKTPGLKEVAKTAPYMHNGIYDSLEEVLVFYNNGGGLGHSMNLSNQTLSSDSLHLNPVEILDLVHFMEAL
jgi:cytochrome c peroxidase